jgi:hypothetical protein
MALANRIMGQSMLTMGDFAGARLHLEKSMQIYNAGQTVTFSGLLYGYSDRVATESFLALALWIIGYPEQASAAAARALARAREIGHATMTAIALLGAAILGDLGADPLGAATHANELLAHCLEHGLANYVPWARYHHGAQLVRRGDAQQGIAVMQAAIREADTTNAKVFRPMHLCHLAGALGNDQPEAGLGALDEAIALVERTDERAFEAELHRLRGELLLASRADGEAATELERALMIARRQQARLWELRAATSLARAWHRQGRNAEARQLLAPVYEWFKEGKALADLHNAQALLDACGPLPA